MNLFLIAKQQIKLLLKSPNMLLLFMAVPFFMIFLFGQAFSKIFASSGFRAIDYFGITLLTMGMFQGAYIAYWGVFKDTQSGTDVRMAIAPVGKSTIVYGIFLGTWIALLVLGYLVFFLAKIFLSVNYGPSLGLILLLLGVESFLAASLGVSLSILIGKEQIAGAILNTLIPVMVFIGGGYTMIPDSGFLHNISVISPVRWVNLAMLSASKQEPNNYTAIAIIICLLSSVILLGLAGLKAWRRK